MWIKAHVGHEGNEMADFMARRGSLKEEEIIVPLAGNLDRKEISEKLRAEWQEEWQKERTCRQTRFFFPKLDPKTSKRILKMGRFNLMGLIPLLTGHNYLAYPMSKEMPDVCPKWRLCEE